MTTRRADVFTLASAVAGLAASSAASYVHYRLLANPYHASFCDVSTTISCTQVYLSPLGSFRGVPVALIAAIWFALAALLATVALVGPVALRRNIPSYLLALCLPALAVAGLLAYVSFAILHLVCLLCLSTDVALIGVGLGTALSDRSPILDAPFRAVHDLRRLIANPTAMVISLVFASLTVGALAVFAREEAASTATGTFTPLADQPRADFERWLVSQPRYPGLVASGEVGVLVVKFNDYQCPPCGSAFREYQEVFERYERDRPGAVRLVLRDYPLDGTCNPYVVNGGKHPSACAAAVAERLSASHERTDAMESWLFSHQPSLTPQLIREAAHEVGHSEDFDARYEETVKLVQADINLGHRLDVTSTPTFFLNGRKIEGVIPARYFAAAIDFELRHDQPTQ